MQHLKKEVKAGHDPKQLVKNGLHRTSVTVCELLDEMISDKRYPMANLSTGYLANIPSNFGKHVFPVLGDRTVESLTMDDCLRISDNLESKGTPSAGKNVLGYASSFYKFARHHPLYRNLQNPLRGAPVDFPRFNQESVCWVGRSWSLCGRERDCQSTTESS